MAFISNRAVNPQRIVGLGLVLTVPDLIVLADTSKQRIYTWMRDRGLPSHPHPRSAKDPRHYFKTWEVWQWAHRNIHPTASAVDRLIQNMQLMANMNLVELKQGREW